MVALFSLSSPFMSTSSKGAALAGLSFPLIVGGAFFGVPVFMPAALVSFGLGSLLMIKGETL